MVQHLQPDVGNASFYAGLLVSAYAFGEVLTAVIWGNISDRIGRKPIVLSGLCGVALSCVMFGLAKKYLVALVARLIGGMLNGNVAVMQTMLAEMVKNPDHERKFRVELCCVQIKLTISATAYAIHPFVWFAGGILGSAMGGYLAEPARYYPSIFSPDGLFGEYPYLLPNIVCVVAIVIAVVQGAIFLKETNPMLAEKARLDSMDTIVGIDEQTPLIKSDVHSNVTGVDSNGSNLRRKPSLMQEAGLPSATDPHFDLRRSSFGTMHSIQVQRPPTPPTPLRNQKPDLRTTFNFTVVMLIGSLILCSYHSMGYFNLLPIYLLDTPSHPGTPGIDLWGGLGYDVHAVGSFMAVNGVISVLVQGLVFPVFVSKLGVWKSFVTMIVLYPLTYPLMPLLTLLPFGPARAAGVYGIMVIQNHLNIIIPPCALILIKNATPSPLVLGTVNGACMSLLSLARTAAPPVQGIIYSTGGSAAAWFSLMGVTVFAFVQLYWIPRERSTQIGGLDVDGINFKARDLEEAEENGDRASLIGGGDEDGVRD
jgi:hypothetical protein